MIPTEDIRSMTLRESPYRPLRFHQKESRKGKKMDTKAKVPRGTITWNWYNSNCKHPLTIFLGKYGNSTWWEHWESLPNKWRQTKIRKRNTAWKCSPRDWAHQPRINTLLTLYPIQSSCFLFVLPFPSPLYFIKAHWINIIFKSQNDSAAWVLLLDLKTKVCMVMLFPSYVFLQFSHHSAFTECCLDDKHLHMAWHKEGYII